MRRHCGEGATVTQHNLWPTPWYRAGDRIACGSDPPYCTLAKSRGVSAALGASQAIHAIRCVQNTSPMPSVTTETAPDNTVALTSAAGAAALLLLVVAPRSSPGCVALLLAALYLSGPPGPPSRVFSLPRPGMPLALLLGLAGWAAVSIAWAADRGEAINKAALLAAFATATAVAATALVEARRDLLQRAGRAALAAFAVGLIYLGVEEITGQGLKRLLFLALPFARPDTRHIVGNDGDAVFAEYFHNRNIAAATLALWPMLLIARHVVEPRQFRAVIAGIAAIALVTLAFSQHETSILALAASSIIGVAVLAAPRLGLGLLAAGWLAATLLVVPMATWGLRTAELHKAEWLPHSARHRIVLWGYTAEQIQHRPLHGIGAASTKALDVRRGPHVETFPGTRFGWRSGTHAHNVYLQIWYELGAIGALLLCGAGLAAIQALSRLPPAVLPAAAATMTAAVVMGASSWGLWQAWFLGAFAMSGMLLLIGIRLSSTRPTPSPGIEPAPNRN